MSVEETVKAEVVAVEAKAETVAEAVATEVKAEVVKVEADVKAEVAKVEEKIKEAVIQLKAEEKLVLADLELEFLKAQTEIQRLSKLAEEKSKQYQSFVEKLYTTYGVTKAEYVFDGAVRVLKAL